jgi:hypothetical protein
MLNILAVSYSQTGQLDEIIDNLVQPLSDLCVDRVRVEPLFSYPFPWTGPAFFDLMPDCVLEHTIPLQPLKLPKKEYDLIIVGYQPWFLSPSLPATSLFRNEEFKALVSGKPVVTVIGARNMWINSQQSVIRFIEEANGTLAGNIPLGDKTNNFVSAVTILHWMLGGKKDKFLGIFPKPGISDEDIQGASKFGKIILDCLRSNQLDELQERILEAETIELPISIIFIEERAKMLFRVWAKIIDKRGSTPRKRKLYVNLFKYYLVVALFVVAPIVLLFYFTIFYPLSRNSAKKKRQYYLKGIIKVHNARSLHYEDR